MFDSLYLRCKLSQPPHCIIVMAARKAAARTSKPSLTRDKVLRQALQMADSGGLGALSMRKLADKLGVEAMSLYNHVQNKDDVIDGIVALVVAKFIVPDTKEHWKVAMRNCAISTHTTLLKHPWAAQLLISRVSASENMMIYSDACYGCLANAGFSYEMTDHAWNAISNHIYGFTLTLINSPIDQADCAQAAKQYLPVVPKESYPHVHEMMLLIISGDYNGVNNLEFGLDLILDGLDSMLVSD